MTPEKFIDNVKRILNIEELSSYQEAALASQYDMILANQTDIEE